MKKLTALLLALLITLSLVGCGKHVDPTPPGPDPGPKPDPEPQPDPEPEPEKASGVNKATPYSFAPSDPDEIYDAIGYEFGVPNAAEDVKYGWCAEDFVAEMSFTLYGERYYAHVSPGFAAKDISAFEYDWNEENFGQPSVITISAPDGSYTVQGERKALLTEAGTANKATFFDGKNNFNYSLCCMSSDTPVSLPVSEVFLLEGEQQDVFTFSIICDGRTYTVQTDSRNTTLMAWAGSDWFDLSSFEECRYDVPEEGNLLLCAGGNWYLPDSRWLGSGARGLYEGCEVYADAYELP